MIFADATEWYQSHNPIKFIDSEIRMRYIHRKVDGIICISSFLNDFYAKQGNCCVLIPPLIDRESNKWKAVPVVLDNKYLNLVYSGSPGSNKDDLEMAILSVIEAKNRCRLHIIGLTDTEFYKNHSQMKQLINKHTQIIFFYGKLSHFESLRFIKSADFVLFLRKSNKVNNAGFPTKFVESISLGTPVITTKTSDLCKYLSNGFDGFFLDDFSLESAVKTLSVIANLSIEEYTNIKSNCLRKTHAFDYRNFINDVSTFLKKTGLE